MLIKVGIVAIDRVDSSNDGVDDNGRDKADDEPDNSIENSVLGVGDFLGIAARNHITDTTNNKHDNSNDANNAEYDIADVLKK